MADEQIRVGSACDAVQAKLDATKPKTAEEALAGHWDQYDSMEANNHGQPSRCRCGYEYQLGRSITTHRIDLLRDAGLLREDKS